MRNRFPGTCYRCGEPVGVGEGHFERLGGIWRTQHASCAIKHRGRPDAERKAFEHLTLLARTKLTGRKGQQARQKLKRQLTEINLEDF